MSVLTINNLTIGLPSGADRKNAVNNISFSISAGETLCLVGESGSGKSVISQCIMGLMPGGLTIEGGTIELMGENLLRESKSRLQELRGKTMAMVFQEPMTALNPVMTCGAQVDEILAAHTSMSKADRKAAVLEIFARVRLPDPERVYQAYPHQLSGGQRQRIVIAIAFILKPKLLICDEPTTALDVTTQAEIINLLKNLQQENNAAVLFITHDFGVVADIADTVVVLRLGQQVESGERDQILQRPATEYTKMLLASVPALTPHARPSVSDDVPLLEARNIFKSYVMKAWPRRSRTVHAARDISLRVRAGETVGIVGESGSGKSTLARCIASLIVPTSGEILISGRKVESGDRRQRTEFRRHVQVVFQDPYRSLNPRQTVGESIIEGLRNFGVSHDTAWKKAETLMGMVRLDASALYRYPDEFSGGQRQRICIARALACEPRVLIADEAVSALDVSVQAQILKLLEDIQKRLRIGILFITHDLRVANQICDRVIVMQSGEVIEEGEAEQIFFRPTQPYTQALLAAAPGRGYLFAHH